jgi:hypothetical protein
VQNFTEKVNSLYYSSTETANKDVIVPERARAPETFLPHYPHPHIVFIKNRPKFIRWTSFECVCMYIFTLCMCIYKRRYSRVVVGRGVFGLWKYILSLGPKLLFNFRIIISQSLTIFYFPSHHCLWHKDNARVIIIYIPTRAFVFCNTTYVYFINTI